MDDLTEIYEIRIKKLLQNLGYYEPKIDEYSEEDMRRYYLDKAFYKKKFDIFQNEIYNGRIELGDY